MEYTHSSIDEQEKELKKTNIVLFDLPEPSTTDTIDTAPTDTDTISKLLTEIDGENTCPKIIKIIRLGRPNPSKLRPCVVTLETREMKYKVLSNSKKLKESTQFSKVILKPDMTKLEQLANKRLVDEL